MQQPSVLRVPHLPPARRVNDTTLKQHNNVPEILCLLHDEKVDGIEIRKSDSKVPSGPKAQRQAHTHEQSMRRGGNQAKKRDTTKPLAAYQPDATDPYCPNVKVPPSTGAQSGRQYRDPKNQNPRRESLLSRLARSLEDRIAASAGSDAAAMSSDDEDISVSEDRKQRRKSESSGPRLHLPPGSYACKHCKYTCNTNKDFTQHMYTEHRDLCLPTAWKNADQTATSMSTNS